MKQTVVIVGADGGIGSALSQKFSDGNWRLYLSFLSRKPLTDTEQIWQQQLDVRKKPDISEFILKLQKELPEGPDVFIYNSGVFLPRLCIANSAAELQKSIDINLAPAVEFLREIAGQMMLKKSGKIFLMSSINSLKCFYNAHVNYAVTKAGLEALVRQAAFEFSRSGVLINAIAPGMVETEMTKPYLDTLKKGRGYDELLQRIAQRRLGRPEEVANFVFALSQKEISYITGQTFCIDGGFQL